MSRLSHLLNLPPPPETFKKRAEAGTDRECYRMAKLNAKRRGIPFELDFDEWLSWWKDTGHYHERGKKRGQYVMGRKGDVGPYALGNIECVQAQENSTAAHRGRILTDEQKRKRREAVVRNRAAKRNPETHYE